MSFETLLFANASTIVLVFIISLFILVKSSDWFTDAAERLGVVLGIPQFIVGVTIVAAGTSLPELATSFVAVLKGNSEIVAANVVGSNIANLLLIIGIVAVVVRHLKVEWELIKVDLPLLLASAFLLTFMLWDGTFTFIEGLFLLVGYIVYIFYSVSLHTKEKKSRKKNLDGKTVFVILGAAFLIYLSAEYTIQSLVSFVELDFIRSMGIDTTKVAITAVAIGTSLPEVSVSIAAARRKNFEVALGNVIGSNIFNSFVVISIPAFFGALMVTQPVLTIAVPVMIAATLMYLVSTQDREVSNYEGAVFLLFYVAFLGKLFGFF